MIKNELIDDIRTKTDIVQVVGEYVPLKKRGKNYLGLCPFHSEKTPSFTVSPDKGIYHCFGCGEGGNVYAFLMKIENISFAESVEMLGTRVGITVEKQGLPSSTQKVNEKYYEIMGLANEFFLNNLNATENQKAKEYLTNRKVSADAIAAFSLGYAPENWDGLINHLYKKGVSHQDMEKLGLIIERNDKSGYYDRFRGRIMFPVYNLRNKVIGFSGRIIPSGKADEEAKYINSPDSPIYNKGFSLYGIQATKDEIKKTKTAVLVEGNVDLVSCWMHGIKNVIAPLGTALTQNQAKIIKRFADNVVIAFDQDNAGNTATGKSVDILKEEELNVYIAKYAGKDPDEALKTAGAESFSRSITEAIPWMEYKVISALSKYNLKEIEAKAKAVKEAALIIGHEKDALIQKGYIKLVSEKTGFTYDEITSEVKRLGFYTSKGRVVSNRSSLEKPKSKLDKAEEMILKMAIENKDILVLLKNEIKSGDFTRKDTRTIAEILQTIEIPSGNEIHFLMENLPDEQTKNFFSSVVMAELPADNILQSAKDCIHTIKAHHLKQQMENLRGEIAESEKNGMLDNVSILHKQFNETNDSYRSLNI